MEINHWLAIRAFAGTIIAFTTAGGRLIVGPNNNGLCPYIYSGAFLSQFVNDVDPWFQGGLLYGFGLQYRSNRFILFADCGDTNNEEFNSGFTNFTGGFLWRY